ncbi:MAG: zinc ribbon domain-containing protein [Romboutsia sp.]|uniref:zinc ribbon domain-containing protein n=1 Tax=Romboutsia sp. TaxID=1965302 RepID=UPI003F402FA9
MNNIKYKFDKRFSKVQEGIDKGREKVEGAKDRGNLNRERNEAQLKKTNVFLEMGQLLYEKIRNNEIIDVDFEEYCNKIIELDKYIYDNNLKIKELKEAKSEKICECGHTIDNNDKFCAECGKRVDIQLSKGETKTCIVCESEIDLECNYCICCGSRIIDINI